MKALSDKKPSLIDAYCRAANTLSVDEIYLYDNPPPKKPLTTEHMKPRLLGQGNHAGSQLHLHPPEPDDREARPRHALRHGPGNLRAYLETSEQLGVLYTRRGGRARNAILDVAGAGKFSSDRTMAGVRRGVSNAKPWAVT